jgi:hypothetical protein
MLPTWKKPKPFMGRSWACRVMGKETGRHVFFQVGEASVLLAFIAETTLKGDHLPSHGAKGPGHFALGIDADAQEGSHKPPTACAICQKDANSSRSRASSGRPRIGSYNFSSLEFLGAMTGARSLRRH